MVSELATTIQSAIDRDRLEIPMLPGAVGEVVALAARMDCEARELVAVIKRDQALMAQLMRMANSALLAPEVPIVSLQLAVGRLGLSRVRDIAVAAALKSRVFSSRSRIEFLRRLFRRALARAFYSQEIARIRRKNVEVAFLAGLLEDVAAPALLALVEEDAISDREIETVIAGFVPDVSARMIEAWRLPAALAQVARHARAPEEAGEAADLARSVRLAGCLAREALHPEEPGEPGDDPAALNLYADDLARLRARRDRVLLLVDSCA